MNIKLSDLSQMIDHSLLHPTMSDKIMIEQCEIAKRYNCASVCIKPYAIPLAKEVLNNSDVIVGTVIGFPHGNSSIEIKVTEAILACKEGAKEVDMVINIGKAIGNCWDYIYQEIKEIHEAVISNDAILKVIFETDFLSEHTIIKLCTICSELKVEYIKTSTGYGFTKLENGMYNYEGATVKNLMIMRKNSHRDIKIKAAGGIRTLKDLLKVRKLGVTRVGATATISILEEAKEILESGKKLEDYDLR